MNTLAYKCGNCHGEHPSLQEVKDCFGLGTPATPAQVQAAQAPAAVNPTWAKLDNAWFVRVPTGTAHEGDTVVVHKRNGDTAEVVLGVMYHAKPGVQFFNAKPAAAAAKGKLQNPGVPEGHYAVDSLTGNNDLDFFRVDVPTEGKWAGYTFVKRVIGGKADSPVKGTTAQQALRAILRAGVQEAALRYGKEIGQCCRCNRHLTDETSRAYGMGPDCRQQVGW